VNYHTARQLGKQVWFVCQTSVMDRLSVLLDAG